MNLFFYNSFTLCKQLRDSSSFANRKRFSPTVKASDYTTFSDFNVSSEMSKRFQHTFEWKIPYFRIQLEIVIISEGAMCFNELVLISRINFRFYSKSTRTVRLFTMPIPTRFAAKEWTKLNCFSQFQFFPPRRTIVLLSDFSCIENSSSFLAFSRFFYEMNNGILCVTNIIKANYSCLANTNIARTTLKTWHTVCARVCVTLNGAKLFERHNSYSSQLTMNALLTLVHCVRVCVCVCVCSSIISTFWHPFVLDLDFDFIFMFVKLLNSLSQRLRVPL